MNSKKEFPVAQLSLEELSQLQQFEEDFRSRTGEEIVLIAYGQQEKN
ncbi:hypothetical protein J9317_07195 [Metabacillus sp. KIGAM252]|uniref:Uncharacterized protein n=1 Tax=Metabacillus flavus TaxID=2823519 RepID=A0ABS5LCT9_9BACI|nr:hypothetical protein [Metabacillus flavus]MBS2968540.1 hypothetical protein [Metabacillus flavus]